MSPIAHIKVNDDDRLQRGIQMFAYRHNINFITKWHNITDSAYGAYLDGLEEHLADCKDPTLEKKLIESLVEGFMKRKTRNFCFIMHMSNFEEISYLISKYEKTDIGST